MGLSVALAIEDDAAGSVLQPIGGRAQQPVREGVPGSEVAVSLLYAIVGEGGRSAPRFSRLAAGGLYLGVSESRVDRLQPTREEAEV